MKSLEATMQRVAELLSGTVKISQRADFPWNVVRGELAGHTPLQIIGFNRTVGTTEHTVWDHVAARFVPATGAERCNVASSDLNDDGSPGTDTGAYTVLIQGLDAAGLAISEVVTLNGTANVLTDAAFQAINAMVATSGGTSRRNEGTITATQMTSGLVIGQMGADLGLSRSGIYTVPTGKTLSVRRFECFPGEFGGPTSFLEYHVYVYLAATGMRLAIREGHTISPITEQIDFGPITLVAGDVLEFTAFTDSGASAVQMIVEAVLVDS